MAAVELARGVEAIKRVAEVFPNAMALVATDQWGTPIRIEPGTVWGGDRMFVTTIAGGVVFTVGDRLYQQGSGDFIRDTYLIALGEGAKKAAWLIPILQAEMAFLMAFVGALAGLLGTIAGVTVFMGKVAVFYTGNKSQIDSASQHIRPFLSGLALITTRCPRLAWLLAKGLGGQVLLSTSQGISAADIAYFLGTVLGSLAKMLGGGVATEVTELTLKGFLNVVKVALLVSSAIRGPGAAVHGAQERAGCATNCNRGLPQQPRYPANIARDGNERGAITAYRRVPKPRIASRTSAVADVIDVVMRMTVGSSVSIHLQSLKFHQWYRCCRLILA